MDLDVTLPRIEPAPAVLAAGGREHATASIRLGGVPRGVAVLLVEDHDPVRGASEPMNALVEHGFESLAASVAGLVAPECERLVAGLLEEVATWDWSPEQVGLVGWGRGGTAALRRCATGDLGAAVGISPALADVREIARADAPVSPWLGMVGELAPDAGLAEEVGSLLDEAPAFTRLVIYPGVGADFHRDAAPALVHAAAFDCWQRVVEWLNVRVSPRPTPYAELWELRQHHSSDVPTPEGTPR